MSQNHAVLDRFPCQPQRIVRLGSAGGMSGAQFWRIEASSGTLILRRWPTEHPTPDRLLFIHAVLRHAAARGIEFLPLPIAARDGRSFVEHAGHLWELAPWLSGVADFDMSASAKKLRAAMTALARFHVAVADFNSTGAERVVVGPTAVSRHVARLRELSRRGAHELAIAVNDETWPELVPLARQFLAALPTALPGAIAGLEPLLEPPLPRQPCIRDIWNDHVLFTGERVTGLIDFGALETDTPATDVARLVGSLVQGTVPFSLERPTGTAFDSDQYDRGPAKRGLSPSHPEESQIWQAALTAYSAVRPLSSQEQRAARALDTSGTILAGWNWIRWLYVDKRRFENRSQVISRFRRVVARAATQ